MAYQDDQIGPRRKGLVDALAGGNTGINGGVTTQAEPIRLEGVQPSAPAPVANAQPEAAPVASPFKFGRDSVSGILGGYDHTPAGLQKAFAEHPELAGASKIGGSKGDKILDPATGKYVDVIQAAGEGGKAWQWLEDDGTGGAAPTTAMPALGGISPMLGSNPLNNSQSALSGIGGFSNSNLLQQLIQQLQGGR